MSWSLPRLRNDNVVGSKSVSRVGKTFCMAEFFARLKKRRRRLMHSALISFFFQQVSTNSEMNGFVNDVCFV